MKSTKFIVRTKSKSYPIYFGKNILHTVGKLIKKDMQHVNKICIISDNKLPKLLFKKLIKSLKKYDLKIYKLSISEKTKNLKSANKIIEELLKNNFNRSDCIIALGGGVVGDLSAFIANLTKRGLRFINIPTTLLAQVDASVGGKTGINSNQGKNLIGTYYQPDFVLSDIAMLKSLPNREMISGYGEILKHSLILDKKFFLWLCKNGSKIINGKNNNNLKEAIIKSCKIKSKIVNKDELEKDLRMILNFGHSFAHGFEKAKNFSKKLNHGEAVLLGMLIASELSNKKNLLSSEELLLIKKHYINLNLPMHINKIFKKSEIDKIIYYMKKDKKNINEKINLILLNGIGKTTKPKSITLNVDEIKKILSSYYF
jgi:3-dehydroquinate synthase/shikimate kinase/3-dehydroquinate synthase